MSERTASAAAKADTLLLVGCGQMGSAMLRGWLARDAAAGFIAIEPAGLPSSFADATSIAWHAAAEELPDDLTPDAVVFAVKPQIINDVLPAYRRWVRPQTLFLSIAAGITISGTLDRLAAAQDTGNLDAEQATALREAFAVVMRVRLEHHAVCLRAGTSPDNRVDPDALPPLQRATLREALREVAAQQKRLSVNVPLGI